MEAVYKQDLKKKNDKLKLLKKLDIAITDFIYQCERKKGTNLDTNLINIVYNTDTITKILSENKIVKIFFTSIFVKTKFKKVFNDINKNLGCVEFITLPSPSLDMQF